MALTLSVEEISRAPLSIKVFLPDGGFVFDMPPSAPSHEAQSSGTKLHFQGSHDEMGRLTFTVWATGPDEDTRSASSSVDAYSQDSSLDYMGCYKVPEAGSMGGLQCAFAQAQAPRFDSAECANSSYQEFSTAPSLDTQQTLGPGPSSAMMQNFEDSDPFAHLDWTPFLDDLTMPQYLLNSQAPFQSIPDMPLETIEAPHENPHITPSHSPLSDVPLSHPSAFDGLSFIPFRPGADPIPVDLDDDPGASLPTPPESSTATTPPPLTPSSSFLAALSSPSAPSPPPDPPEIESTLPPPDPTRPYKCSHPGCHLWFKRAYTRRVHMTTHSGVASAEKRFPCSVAGCVMQFSRKHDRLRHEAGSHGRGTRWRCGACGTHFSTETTLERHRLDRHGI